MIWNCRDVRFEIDRPLVMGIVNATPDSFSDGGRYRDPRAAIQHALKLAEEGADILDIGGESTRPGATPVDTAEELDRVLPVIEALNQRPVPISIDTMKAAVAEAALAAGACIVNDVSGFRDPAMIAVAAKFKAGVVVNHMQGTPTDMQLAPHYDHVVNEVNEYLKMQADRLIASGVGPQSICLDPGIGFGKTLEQTLLQLQQLKSLAALGYPVCLGISRKGFLGQITRRDRVHRLAGTLAVNCFAMEHVHVLRVHDVAEHVDAVKLWQAIKQR